MLEFFEGVHISTFRKLLLMTSSRRLEVKDRLNVNFKQFFLKTWRIYWILAGWKSLSSRLFAFPGGSNLGLKVVRETTISWGWHRSTKTIEYVPNPKPPKLPELLHEWF